MRAELEPVAIVAGTDQLTLMLTLLPHADRTQRVKDARGEAAKEIEAYKSKQESEFQAFEKEVCGEDIASFYQSLVDHKTDFPSSWMC